MLSRANALTPAFMLEIFSGSFDFAPLSNVGHKSPWRSAQDSQDQRIGTKKQPQGNGQNRRAVLIHPFTRVAAPPSGPRALPGERANN
jgi:hypothetical protein